MFSCQLSEPFQNVLKIPTHIILNNVTPEVLNTHNLCQEFFSCCFFSYSGVIFFKLDTCKIVRPVSSASAALVSRVGYGRGFSSSQARSLAVASLGKVAFFLPFGQMFFGGRNLRWQKFWETEEIFDVIYVCKRKFASVIRYPFR